MDEIADKMASIVDNNKITIDAAIKRFDTLENNIMHRQIDMQCGVLYSATANQPHPQKTAPQKYMSACNCPEEKECT